MSKSGKIKPKVEQSEGGNMTINIFIVQSPSAELVLVQGWVLTDERTAGQANSRMNLYNLRPDGQDSLSSDEEGWFWDLSRDVERCRAMQERSVVEDRMSIRIVWWRD